MPQSSAPSNFTSEFHVLQRDVACPACYGALQLSADWLICTQCDRRYPMVDGIPILIREAALRAE